MTKQTVRPGDVVGALAQQRPPAVRAVSLDVKPNEVTDPTRLEDILQAVITEVLTSWPSGTTWVVDLGCGYLQGLTYTPTCLLEFAPAPPRSVDWELAKEAGWLDPHTVPKGHGDFESRPLWANNPVQELSFASTGIPAMVALLADAADTQLRAPRGAGLGIKVFCNAPDEGTGEEVFASADLPAVVEVASVSVLVGS